jgi:hypothetical protein
MARLAQLTEKKEIPEIIICSLNSLSFVSQSRSERVSEKYLQAARQWDAIGV